MSSSTSVMERCCASGAAIAAERAEQAAEAARLTAQRVAEAYDVAAEALAVAREAEKIRDMSTGAHALDTGEPPTAEYDRPSNHMEFGLPKGDPGPPGPPGPPPDFVGYKESAADLPPLGEPGQGWFLTNGDLYYWRPCASAWTYVGNFKGPQGEGFVINGTLASEAELPSTGDGGGGWIINGWLYLWDAGEQAWKKSTKLQGDSPYIGANGNWWVGETDTGVKAAGGGRGLGNGILTGAAGAPSATLPVGKDGDLELIEELGIFIYKSGATDAVDGVHCLTTPTGVGRWKLLIPVRSLDRLLA